MLKSFCRSRPQRWAVFISGRGSNLSAIIQKMRVEEMGSLVVVFTSKPHAYGVKRARRFGVEVRSIPLQGKKVDYSRLESDLQKLKISRIFLAGYMKILPENFIDHWRDRICNLHPSLLPDYPGLQSIERAFADRSALGCTVHLVVPVVDAGPILLCRELQLPYPKDLQEAERRMHLLEQVSVRRVVGQL